MPLLEPTGLDQTPLFVIQQCTRRLGLMVGNATGLGCMEIRCTLSGHGVVLTTASE